MSTVSSVTQANFKKRQLDHLIDVILEASRDIDHPAQQIGEEYPANNVQDYINIDWTELDSMNLTKSNSTDAASIPNALKKQIISLKDFWKHWGDKSTKDWSVLTIDNFDDFLMDGTGPQTQSVRASTTVPPTTGAMTPAMNVNVITSVLSAAMLTKPPSLRTVVFMKNKGGGDDVKALN